ncbi:MAG: hypothetical protein ACBR21_18650 [Microcoleus sp.]
MKRFGHCRLLYIIPVQPELISRAIALSQSKGDRYASNRSLPNQPRRIPRPWTD